MTSTPAAPGSRAPLLGALPGEAVPYSLASGDGLRRVVDGQLVTIIARGADTGDQFAAAYVSGDRGAEFPVLAHPQESRTIIVFDGLLQVRVGDTTQVLAVGDEAVVPAGTAFGYRMLANRTRFLLWSTTGASIELLDRLGTPTDGHVHPPRRSGASLRSEAVEVARELGFAASPFDGGEPVLRHGDRRPAGVEPYVLSAGEGEHLAGFNQMHTFTSRGANTGGDYFTVHSSGARAGYIPLHFHERHTENFFCFEGRVWLHVNGEELLLTKGDFVHAPAGTIHSYAFDSHHTQMIGMLSPDIFEPFFDYMFEPTDERVHTETVEPYFNSAGFGRVQSELDIVVVGAPPLRAKALDL